MATGGATFSTSATDVVGIFDLQSFNQLFAKARAIKAKVAETASVMSHPVEDGSTITDHTIINPIEIELSCIIASEDYRTEYESIKSYYLKSTLLAVQTRSGVYRNMLISAMPHDEDPEFFGAITLAIKLVEVKFAKFTTGTAPKVSEPKSTKHTSTKDTGKKQPTMASAPAEKQSILYGWTS